MELNNVLLGKECGSILGCSVRVFHINGRMTTGFRKRITSERNPLQFHEITLDSNPTSDLRDRHPTS